MSKKLIKTLPDGEKVQAIKVIPVEDVQKQTVRPNKYKLYTLTTNEVVQGVVIVNSSGNPISYE